jgi:predicted phosphohydrolase
MNLLSDIHIEMFKNLDAEIYSLKPFIDEEKHLLLPGDIGLFSDISSLKRCFQILRSFVNSDKHIFYTPGNHEYYYLNESIENTDKQLRLICEDLNIIFLQKDVFQNDEFILLGCTLWSFINEKSFNFLLKSNKIFLSQYDAIKLHCDHVDWIQKTLQTFENISKPKIVMTHYLPSKKITHPKFLGNIFNSGYSSNLDYLVKKSDVWVFGHTHEKISTMMENTKLYCNPVGYVGEERQTKLTKMIIEFKK